MTSVDDFRVNHAVGTRRPDHLDLQAYGNEGSPIGNTLQGLDGSDYLTSQVLADPGCVVDCFSIIHGGNGDDFIYNYIYETLGNATAASYGGKGNDRVVMSAQGIAGAVSVSADGAGGDDWLEMWAGGGSARIVARGGRGRDTIVAHTDGETTIVGGLGNDLSFLSAGADSFVFAQTSHQGADVVKGWDRAEDRLVLYGWDDTARVTDNGADVRVGFSNGSSIVFRGAGNGAIDSVYDLVDDPGQIVDTWLD